MWKRTLRTCALMYIPFFALGLTLHQCQEREHVARQSHIQKKKVGDKARQLEYLWRSLIDNTEYWANRPYPIGFGQGDHEDDFVWPYVDLIQGIPTYQEIGFMDIHGKEFLRYRRNGKGEMKQAGPRDNARRAYFREGLSLQKGQVIVSPIGTHPGEGEEEVAEDPIVRGLGPIFDTSDGPVGLVAISFTLEELFGSEGGGMSKAKLYLVDGQGNIILSNGPMPEDRPDLEAPSNGGTTYEGDGGLWTYVDLQLGLGGEGRQASFSDTAQGMGEDHWGMVIVVPLDHANAGFWPRYGNFLAFNLSTILLIAMIGSVHFKKLREKKRFHSELEDRDRSLLRHKSELEASHGRLKQANHRLQIHNRQLVEFNHVAAYNLKEPVSSLSRIVQMIKKANRHGEFVALLPKLDLISANISMLADDIESYVSILGQRDLPFEKVHLRSMLEQIWKDLTKEEYKGRTGDFHVLYRFDSWDTLTTSRSHMEGILRELMSNALKYWRPEAKSHVIFESALEDHKKVLYIRDNGMGIDLWLHRDNLFKPYHRFHRGVPGKGIGLFLARAKLEALDASLTLDRAQEGVGTSLKIIFGTL